MLPDDEPEDDVRLLSLKRIQCLAHTLRQGMLCDYRHSKELGVQLAVNSVLRADKAVLRLLTLMNAAANEYCTHSLCSLVSLSTNGCTHE